METNYKNNIHFVLKRFSRIIAENVKKKKEWEFCKDVLDNLVKGLNYGMPYTNNLKKQMHEDRDKMKTKRHDFKLITLKDVRGKNYDK